MAEELEICAGTDTLRAGDEPPGLAGTRMQPPRQNITLLDRQRLLESLAEATVGVRLVVVSAPAGHGKTVLLGQLRERARAQGTLVAWLTLDDDDAPDECLEHLASALRGAGVGVPHRDSNGESATNPRRGIRWLLQAIEAANRPVVMMLDEFERASDAVEALILGPLLRQAPANLQVVVAGRRRPGVACASLRARGLICELGARELRLRTEEIAQLFDCQLGRRALGAIAAATAGWPAVVQLLRAAWARGSVIVPVETGPAFADVAAYIEEEVLAALPCELQEILAEIAILDVLDERSVAAVTSRPHAWRSLVESERLSDLLLEASGEAPARRLNPLVRAVMLARAERLDPQRRAAVLHAAACHLARIGKLTRSIELAVASGDLDLASRLVLDAGGVHIWIRRGKAITYAIDSLLPEALLERHPRIRLLRALVQIKRGQLRAGRQNFEQVRAIAGARAADGDDPELAELRHDALVVEVTLLINECRPAGDRYLASFEAALKSVQPGDHTLKGLVRNLICVASSQRALFDKATAAAYAAIDEYRLAGSTHGQLFEHLHLGAMAFAKGLPAVARSSYARARELARRHFREDQTKTVLLNALSAELAYEQNALGQALRLVRQGAVHLRQAELWHDIYAAHFVTAAMVALARGGVAEALATIHGAEQEAIERNALGVLRLFDATRISCLALAGSVDEAREVLRERNLDLLEYLSSDEDRLWREREAVLVSCLRLAARHSDVAVPVPTVEETLIRLWSSQQVRTAIRVGTALATYYWTVGRPAQALGHLDSVLRASQRSGYRRALLEDASFVRPVLTRWRADARENTAPELIRHADELVCMLGGDDQVPIAAPALTDREREILQEIARGRSDKEIARTLHLSENTVKFHLKNLYAKLQVGRRIDAIEQARRRGIAH